MKFLHLEDIKKFSRFFILVASVIFAAICSGCTNLDDGTAYIVIKDVASHSYSLTMNVTSDDGFRLFSYSSSEGEMLSAARTILPDYEASDFKYYLIYKDMRSGTSWQIDRNIKFNATSKTTGTVTKTFSPSYYAFYLYALTPERAETWESAGISTINESTLINFASLKAHTYIDLANTDSLTFHLKANEYSKGKGGFSVVINHTNSWTVDTSYKITVGLYDIGTNELVYPSTEPQVIIRNGAAGGGSVSNYLFETPSAYSVATGTYNLAVTYSHYSNGDVVSESSHSEKISILMNMNSVGTVNIPYFLDDAPKAPSCFIAGYKKPTDSNKGNYKVQFAWCDNSFIEQYFKLQLIEIKGDSLIIAPESDSEWNLLQGYYGTTDTLAGLSVTGESNVFTEKGMLYKNTTNLELNFPLGKRYVARLCSTNSVGDSDWVYLKLPQTKTYTSPLDSEQSATLDDEYSCFENDVQTINLYRVSYILGDGEISAFDSAKNETDIPLLTFYESQKNSDTVSAFARKILVPDGITENSYIAEDGVTAISNATLVLKTSLGCWNAWSGIVPSVQYVASSADFIDGINYYEYEAASSSYKKLSNQPAAGTDCSSYYIRKVSVPTYSGYNNISYIAEYDEKEIDTDMYELLPKNISVLFLANGSWTYEITSGMTYSDSNGDGYLTLGDNSVENILTVSKSKVDNIYFTINDNDTYDYSSVSLSLKRITGGTSVLIDNQAYNSQKQWSISLGGMDPGYYLLTFDAKVADIKKTMTCICILNLID